MVRRTVTVGEELESIDTGARASLNPNAALVRLEVEFELAAAKPALAASRDLLTGREDEDALCDVDAISRLSSPGKGCLSHLNSVNLGPASDLDGLQISRHRIAHVGEHVKVIARRRALQGTDADAGAFQLAGVGPQGLAARFLSVGTTSGAWRFTHLDVVQNVAGRALEAHESALAYPVVSSQRILASATAAVLWREPSSRRLKLHSVDVDTGLNPNRLLVISTKLGHVSG
jgi:hypothetical protein